MTDTQLGLDLPPLDLPPLDPADGERTLALDRAHVFHSWSAQGSLAPLAFAGGSGVELWDFAGKRYLDFSSQLVNTNLGHCLLYTSDAAEE